MKKLLLLFVLFLLFNCYSPRIKLNKDKISKVEENSQEKIFIDHLNYDVQINEFVYLFFDRSYFVEKKPIAITPTKEKVTVIDSNDYKAIVDWQVEGGRQIRLLNLKTGKEYIIKDWEKNGEVVLLERNLFYYKFKIGNTIIKVKR